MPDKEGRREILQIHFEPLRRRGRLSLPLCQAIDGVPSTGSDTYSLDGAGLKANTSIEGTIDEMTSVKGRKRRAMKKALNKVIDKVPVVRGPGYDLAANYATGGFSGADIAGLVRCAGSLALSRAREQGGGVDNLLITMEDVKQALQEVKK